MRFAGVVPGPHGHPSSRQRGAALLEAIVSSAIVVTVASGVGHLLISSRRAAWSAGADTRAAVLASEKLEQLRSLSWHVDAAGVPVSDVTTDLSTTPAGGGGFGLQRSPAGTLARSVAGYVDYLDADGRWRGTGPRPPAGAAFIRRWSIAPFAADQADTLLLTVVVLPIAEAQPDGPRVRGVRLHTIRTRTTT